MYPKYMPHHHRCRSHLTILCQILLPTQHSFIYEYTPPPLSSLSSVLMTLYPPGSASNCSIDMFANSFKLVAHILTFVLSWRISVGRDHIGMAYLSGAWTHRHSANSFSFFLFFYYSNLGVGAGYMSLIISLKSVFLGLHSIHTTYNNTFKTMYNNDSGEGGVLMLGLLM